MNNSSIRDYIYMVSFLLHYNIGTPSRRELGRRSLNATKATAPANKSCMQTGDHRYTRAGSRHVSVLASSRGACHERVGASVVHINILLIAQFCTRGRPGRCPTRSAAGGGGPGRCTTYSNSTYGASFCPLASYFCPCPDGLVRVWILRPCMSNSPSLLH